MAEQLLSFPNEWEKPQGFVPVGPHAQQKALFGVDSELNVRFVMYPEIDELQTLNQGFKVLNYKEYVRIQRPGDRTTVVFREAKMSDRGRFPLQYEAFKSGKSEKIGIPLEAWDYQLGETDLYTFKVLGIEYVHEIANMSDVQQLTLGIDAKNIVARAKITCSEVSEKDAAAALQAKFDEQTEMYKKLEQANKDMEERMLALMAQKSSERGYRGIEDEDPIDHAAQLASRRKKLVDA